MISGSTGQEVREQKKAKQQAYLGEQVTLVNAESSVLLRPLGDKAEHVSAFHYWSIYPHLWTECMCLSKFICWSPKPQCGSIWNKEVIRDK